MPLSTYALAVTPLYGKLWPTIGTIEEEWNFRRCTHWISRGALREEPLEEQEPDSGLKKQPKQPEKKKFGRR